MSSETIRIVETLPLDVNVRTERISPDRKNRERRQYRRRKPEPEKSEVYNLKGQVASEPPSTLDVTA